MVTHNHFPLNTDSDDGGPWLLDKYVEEFSTLTLDTQKYQGNVTIGSDSSGDFLLGDRPTSPSDDQLEQHGTTMIARSVPNDPSADLAVSGAEILREGVPSIVGLTTLKSRSLAARNAGKEYLNLEFGWKPLVSEVRTLAKSVRESEQTWSAYRKGSGKKTRVGYHMDDLTSTRVYHGNFLPIPSGVNEFVTNGTLIEQTRNHTWFKGAFKYYVPEPVDFPSKMQYWNSQASKILGLRLDPEVMWNLAPWSWAVDWFTNTGDVLKNISLLGKDGLALQYGYAMSEQSILIERTGSILGQSLWRNSLSKRCRRLPATPYGFGVDMSALSGRQIAILAALGISRT